MVRAATKAMGWLPRLPNHGPQTSVDQYYRTPYIVKGYRHVSCASESFLSSFTLSNEVLNIWSHFLGALVFLVSTCSLLLEAWAWESSIFVTESYLPLLIQQLGCVVVMTGSTLAHVFHSQSDWHHQALFVVDYFSISYYCVSAAIAHYSYSRPTNADVGPIAAFSAAHYLYVALVSHLCVFMSQCYVRFRLYASPYRPFVLLGGYAVSYGVNLLPFLSRYASGEHLASDPYHWAQLFWSFVSAAVMAAHLPERLRPDWFYFLHGHALMHIFIFWSIVQQRTALLLDMHHRRQLADAAQPTVALIATVIGLYVALGGLFGWYVSFRGLDIQKLKAANNLVPKK